MRLLAFLPLLLVSVAASDLANLISPLYLKSVLSNRIQGLPSISPRITGGSVAQNTEYAYQVGLKIQYVSLRTFCGGTLISDKYVLTAANCCEGAQYVEAVFGTTKIYNETSPGRVSMNIPKENIKVHEQWDRTNLLNDICLLKLPNAIQLSEQIQIAMLPKNDRKTFLDEYVIATGWGSESDQSHVITADLRFVKSKVIPNLLCNVFYIGKITNTHICMDGIGGRSTCSGDAGGPLVLAKKESDSSTLVGVTSFGFKFGCEKGWPSAFTRVSKYLQWIKDNMT